MHETVQIKRLQAMAGRRGWSWEAEPGSGFCGRLRVGERAWMVIGADLGVNSAAAARIARDKLFAQHFLARAGLPTIPTRALHLAAEAAGLTDFPVLLKPNEGQGGVGVSLVESAEDLGQAYDLARLHSPLVLAQPYLRQREFRVVVFDRRPQLAYEKRPLILVGDGRRAVRELLPPALLGDPRLPLRLHQAALTLDSVLAPGREITPLPVANLKAGGTWRSCLPELSPALVETSVAAAASLELVMAGVDLFAERPDAGACVINEVNAAPGFERIAAQPGLLDPLFAAIEDYFSRQLRGY